MAFASRTNEPVTPATSGRAAVRPRLSVPVLVPVIIIKAGKRMT